MAKPGGELRISVDIDPICYVKCGSFTCKHNLRDTACCNLKHIKLDMDGKCKNFKPANEA